MIRILAIVSLIVTLSGCREAASELLPPIRVGDEVMVEPDRGDGYQEVLAVRGKWLKLEVLSPHGAGGEWVNADRLDCLIILREAPPVESKKAN